MAERPRPPHAASPPMHHTQSPPLQQQQLYGRGPTDLPLSLTSLMLLLRDTEYLTARYGSTAAACARLEELERAHMDMQAQIAALQQKLSMAMVAAAAAQVDVDRSTNGTRLPLAPTLFDVDALLGFLQRHCACRGDLGLLAPVLGDFQRSLVLPSDARFPSREILVSVQEIVDVSHPQNSSVFVHMNEPAPVGQSPMPHEFVRTKRHPDITRLTPKDKAPGSAASSPVRANGQGTSTPRLIAPAGGRVPSVASGDRRTRQEEKQTASAAAMLSALSRPAPKATERPGAKTPPTTRRSHSDATGANPISTTTASAAATGQQKKRASQRTQETAREETNTTASDKSGSEAPADTDDGDGAVNTRKRSTSMAAAASHEVVVKQNLSLPHDKRNIVELKQSSQHLTLENLDELNRRAPWDEVYKLRATFSHVLDYRTLDEAARKWFISALRVQFIWRREFWERLHWLPMSEAVCVGAGWERYRQTRKRRANKAIAAWRKLYSDSLELMRQRLLPEDVWCDVALWYMPSTPLYWLPNSPNLGAELSLVDAKHPVRCYFVQDFRKHPFYNDDDIQRKYPHKYDLPTPQMLAVPTEDKESRVNITPE